MINIRNTIRISNKKTALMEVSSFRQGSFPFIPAISFYFSYSGF